jgi:hypothetical protein
MSINGMTSLIKVRAIKYCSELQGRGKSLCTTMEKFSKIQLMQKHGNKRLVENAAIDV